MHTHDRTYNKNAAIVVVLPDKYKTLQILQRFLKIRFGEKEMLSRLRALVLNISEKTMSAQKLQRK